MLFRSTLSDASIEELDEWRDKILDKLKKLPQLADVTSDKERGGLRASVVIDRNAASRMNVPIASAKSLFMCSPNWFAQG